MQKQFKPPHWLELGHENLNMTLTKDAIFCSKCTRNYLADVLTACARYHAITGFMGYDPSGRKRQEKKMRQQSRMDDNIYNTFF